MAQPINNPPITTKTELYGTFTVWARNLDRALALQAKQGTSLALNLDSITFQPQMLTATLNNITGILSYSVNQTGSASLSLTSYVSAIDQAIGMLNTVFAEYVSVSRAMAVRMAFQGGLSAFFPELKYDVATDKFTATSTHQLVPMFKQVLNAAPADNTNHAIDHYLNNWNEILWRIYPDYVISGGQSLNGAANDNTLWVKAA